MSSIPHRRYPCTECPWRRDTEPGSFPAERYEALQATTGAPGAEAGLNAPLFACHKSVPGRDEACAGWLAAAGAEHLGVRLAVATGRLPATCLTPGVDWPELFDTYTEMAETQAAQPRSLACPSTAMTPNS